MSNHRLVELRPIDLAAVWGTAFGQLADLWKAASTALIEAGSAESDTVGEYTDHVTVPLVEGAVPTLKVQNMIGESFGEKLPDNAVKLTPREPANGMVIVDCTVDESASGPIVGDIYRGEVVDANGNLVGRIALDAGS